MPFAEQQNLYDIIKSGPDLGGRKGMDRLMHAMDDTTVEIWTNLTDEQKRGFASVSYMRCPTRRGTGEYSTSDAAAPYPPGPHTDYAPVFYVRDRPTGGTIHDLRNGWDSYTPPVPTGLESATGPWRAAITDTVPQVDQDVSNWKIRDTMSWWSDGTSNQIIFGEKHISTSSPATGPASSWMISPQDGNPTLLDQSYLAGAMGSSTVGGLPSTECTMAVARIVHPQIPIQRPIDMPPAATVPNQRGYFTFGSWHPGICHFLLGDGSARSVSNTVDPDLVLSRLAEVHDGRPVALP